MIAGLAVDTAGNSYVTGQYFATTDFDPGVATASLTNIGQNDCFLSRYDSAGNLYRANASVVEWSLY